MLLCKMQVVDQELRLVLLMQHLPKQRLSKNVHKQPKSKDMHKQLKQNMHKKLSIKPVALVRRSCASASASASVGNITSENCLLITAAWSLGSIWGQSYGISQSGCLYGTRLRSILLVSEENCRPGSPGLMSRDRIC